MPLGLMERVALEQSLEGARQTAENLSDRQEQASVSNRLDEAWADGQERQAAESESLADQVAIAIENAFKRPPVAKAMNFPANSWINGKFTGAKSGDTYETTNPATGEVLAQVASCGEDEVNYAVKKARQAFDAGLPGIITPRRPSFLISSINGSLNRNPSRCTRLYLPKRSITTQWACGTV